MTVAANGAQLRRRLMIPLGGIAISAAALAICAAFGNVAYRFIAAPGTVPIMLTLLGVTIGAWALRRLIVRVAPAGHNVEPVEPPARWAAALIVVRLCLFVAFLLLGVVTLLGLAAGLEVVPAAEAILLVLVTYAAFSLLMEAPMRAFCLVRAWGGFKPRRR